MTNPFIFLYAFLGIFSGALKVSIGLIAIIIMFKFVIDIIGSVVKNSKVFRFIANILSIICIPFSFLRDLIYVQIGFRLGLKYDAPDRRNTENKSLYKSFTPVVTLKKGLVLGLIPFIIGLGTTIGAIALRNLFITFPMEQYQILLIQILFGYVIFGAWFYLIPEWIGIRLMLETIAKTYPEIMVVVGVGAILTFLAMIFWGWLIPLINFGIYLIIALFFIIRKNYFKFLNKQGVKNES